MCAVLLRANTPGHHASFLIVHELIIICTQCGNNIISSTEAQFPGNSSHGNRCSIISTPLRMTWTWPGYCICHSNHDNCIVARQQLSWQCLLTCPVPICQACCLLEGQCGAHVAPLLLLVSGAWVDFWQALLSVVEDHVTVWRERARAGVGQCGVHKTGDVHAQTTTPHTHTQSRNHTH